MAIVTISQIKNRRGIKGVDPMPQLASAEFGWAVDAQELYIGNGTISEGAPVIGNTEILTEHSDLSALITDYTYSGPFIGATMQTGGSPVTPVTRSDTAYKDDRVSVRAFGAVGDGITDDTAAIERAIDQHYTQVAAVSNNRYWTTIYFPAGTYRISSNLQIPSRVRLVGDGFNSSILRLDLAAGNTQLLLIEDDPNPIEDIYIAGLGLEVLASTSHVCRVTEATNVTFERCAFRGASADTTALGSSKACVIFNEELIEATVGKTATSNIRFSYCLFTGATYGIATSTELAGNERYQNVYNVVVEGCVFNDLYKGIVLGFETGTNAVTDSFPTEWRIYGNYFDVITRHGIHSYKANKCTSSMNHFGDVGNLQTATVTYPNITFGDTGGENPIDTLVTLADYANNYSIGDHFDRTDADNLTSNRVESFCNDSYIIDPDDIRYGSLHVEPGRLILLADNTAAATTTGIALDSTLYHGAIIDYQINRGTTQRRTGTLTLTLGTLGADQGLVDDFIETPTTVGVTFTLATAAGVGTIEYTTTDSTNNAVLSYSIRHLTCVLATPTVGV